MNESYEFHEDQAITEGWCVSTCIGSMEVPEEWSEIQRVDELDIFESDHAALAFVAGKAASGSLYHRSALHYMDKRNFKLLNDAFAEIESLRGD